MRKQHHQTGEQSPFIFAGDDELVDDDLRAIGEIAELCLPQHQAIRIVAAESIFKTQHGSFGQNRVVGRKPCLIGREVRKRHVFLFVFSID